MAKFILLYKGPATPAEEMSRDKVDEVMGAWKNWMQSIGDALVDVGQPMTNGRTLADNGVVTDATDLNGYSILEAENIEHAIELTKNHPFLSDKDGKFFVEIHELMPPPEMN